MHKNNEYKYKYYQCLHVGTIQEIAIVVFFEKRDANCELLCYVIVIIFVIIWHRNKRFTTRIFYSSDFRCIFIFLGKRNIYFVACYFMLKVVYVNMFMQTFLFVYTHLLINVNISNFYKNISKIVHLFFLGTFINLCKLFE